MNVTDVNLAIILVNYKSLDETVLYVRDELAKVSVPNCVVIVNNSDDGEHGNVLASALDADLYSSDDLSRPPSSHCVVISEPANLGYAKGNNLGFRFINQHFKSVDWLLITNNDLELGDEEVVGELLNELELHPNVGVIGPRIRTPSGADQSPHRYRSIWAMLIMPKLLFPIWAFYRKAGFGREVISNASCGIYHRIMGSFFLVRADAFRQVGGFDDRTFLYGEEVILSSRLRKIGYDTYFSSKQSVIHKHGQTTSSWFSRRQTKHQMLESMLIYYRDYDMQPSWVCRLAILADQIQAHVYEPIVKFVRKSIFRIGANRQG